MPEYHRQLLVDRVVEILVLAVPDGSQLFGAAVQRKADDRHKDRQRQHQPRGNADAEKRPGILHHRNQGIRFNVCGKIADHAADQRTYNGKQQEFGQGFSVCPLDFIIFHLPFPPANRKLPLP